MTGSDARTAVGRVAAIWRYPVKSMRGERVATSDIGPGGLSGDRRFAVIDRETGKVASAKNPRKWPRLLEIRAELRDGIPVVTLPGGDEFRDDLDAVLSRFLVRAVELRESPTPGAEIEVEWPAVPGLPGAGSESVEVLPAGAYFDLAPIHLVTTATLSRLRELSGTDCDERRFRPNVVVEVFPECTGFVEREWVGRSLVVGDSEMRLAVTAECSRCVMTTLAQPGLPAAPQVLRAAVEHNDATVGVYARADRTGTLAEGAPVWLK